MRKTLRFIAAAASLAAASITVGVTGGYDDGLFGWTNGKQCSIANGCITKPTVAMCLDCCDFYCQSVLTECFDTCLPDEPAAIMAVRDADKAIRAGVWTTENISTLQRAQHSARKRVRDMARALSEESVLRSMLVQPAVPGRGEPDQHTTADSIVSPFTLL